MTREAMNKQVEIAVAGPMGPVWIPGTIERGPYLIPHVRGERFDVMTERGLFRGISPLSMKEAS
jgi:hypothetical protein